MPDTPARQKEGVSISAHPSDCVQVHREQLLFSRYCDPPSLNMKSAAELVVQLVPWSAETAFIPRLYVPAVFTRQYTIAPEAPSVADTTIAYFVPAVTEYPVENWYSYHVAVVVRLDARNVVLVSADPVGASPVVAYRLMVTV
jgi:hypothetical protein